MNKNRSVISALLLSLFFFACPACSPVDIPALSQDCEAIVSGKDAFLHAPRDPFTFEQVAIQDDCLEITISYAGGCGATSSQLYYEGSLSGNNLSSAELALSFSDEDPCEAIVQETLNFSLVSLQPADSSLNKLQLKLEGYDPVLSYDF